MSWSVGKMKCCGINELVGMNEGQRFSPKKLMEFICKTFQYNIRSSTEYAIKGAGRAAFILTYAYYTPGEEYDPVGKRKGQKSLHQCEYRTKVLTSYITKHKLGTLLVAPDVGNPNYHNGTTIRTMVFSPNQKAMVKFAQKNKWTERSAPTLNFWIGT